MKKETLDVGKVNKALCSERRRGREENSLKGFRHIQEGMVVDGSWNRR
jgi:hypothetical protein